MPAILTLKIPFFFLMVGGNWWWPAIGAIAIFELKRPSVSELAVAETSLLRQEISQLRDLVERLDDRLRAADWENWFQLRLIRGLILALILAGFRLWLGLRSGEHVVAIQSDPVKCISGAPTTISSESDSSPTSRALTGSTGSLRSSGPLRPSDLKKLRDGIDSGPARGAGVGALSGGPSRPDMAS